MKVFNRDRKLLIQIGEKVRRARLLKGLTQQQLANKIIMKRGALSEIECGKSAMFITTLNEIAKALDLDIKEFL